MNIRFVDIGRTDAPLLAELQEAFTRHATRSSFILGESVERFEREFAEYCGVKHCIGVSSGTMALQLALKAQGVGDGDKVVTTPNTFVATVEAICHTGATPVFVDVIPETFNIDTSLLEANWTSHVKAIIPVHMYGQMADMWGVRNFANKFGYKVIEDACQAHGATYRSARAGSVLANGVACYSFYPSKNLGAYGDAGAVVTDDDAVDEQVRSLRNHGAQDKHWHERIGFTARMDSLQASILSVKLKHLDKWNAMRLSIAEQYNEGLGNIDEIVLPSVCEYQTPVYHLYVIRAQQKVELRGRLAARKIETGLHYLLPIHRQKAYAHLGYPQGSFPVAESLAKEIVSLPMYPTLSSEEVSRVCECIREFYEIM